MNQSQLLLKVTVSKAQVKKTMYVQCDSASNWVAVKNFDCGGFQNMIQMPYHDLYFVCKMFGNQNSLFSHPLNSASLDSLKVLDLSDKYVTVQVPFCTLNSCLSIDVCLYNL
jgi:hypothetical protein